MNKSNKNIIAILLIFVMVICIFFTLKAINPKMNIPTNFDTSKINFNDKDGTDRKGNRPSSRPSKPGERSKDNTETSENEQTDNTESNSANNTKREFNFDNKDFKVERSNTSSIYYILYFIESATIGGCSVFLVYNNKKEDKKNK